MITRVLPPSELISIAGEIEQQETCLSHQATIAATQTKRPHPTHGLYS
jgi:hypothetical protein